MLKLLFCGAAEQSIKLANASHDFRQKFFMDPATPRWLTPAYALPQTPTQSGIEFYRLNRNGKGKALPAAAIFSVAKDIAQKHGLTISFNAQNPYEISFTDPAPAPVGADAPLELNIAA